MQGHGAVSYLLEAEGMNEKTQYDISNNIEQLSISMAGSGEIEVKAVLAFCSFIRQPVQTEVIDNITMEPYQTEELERRPGIVGYIVKEERNCGHWQSGTVPQLTGSVQSMG